MTQVLTWRYLSPEHVHRCLTAPDTDSTYAAIEDADAANPDEFKLLKTAFIHTAPKGNGDGSTRHTVLYLQPHATEQREVLRDLYYHLILWCRENDMSPEKTSATVGIVARTHLESMAGLLSRPQSFALFGQLLQLHAVHRPPFSAALLSIADAKALTDYLLSTYYRHYKMYLYAFTPQRTATVRGITVGGSGVLAPPIVPPQTSAVPLQRFEAVKAVELEAARRAEMELDREQQARKAEERERALEEQRRIPPVPAGLQQQLAAIRQGVSQMSVAKLSQLEAKLDKIESRISESQQQAAQSPAGVRGRHTTPPKRKF